MLPKSLIEFLPDRLAENIDADGQAFVDFVDQFCIDIFQDILGIWYFKFPTHTAIATLNEWGVYLEAEIYENDTERQKREKIATAIKRHKLRGTFEGDIKLRIDIITGKDSQVVKATYIFEDDDSIIVGGANYLETMYSTIGTDGVGEYGMYIPEISTSSTTSPGFISIDLGYTEDEIIIIEDDDSIIVGDGVTAGTTYYSTIGVDGIDSDLGMFIPSGEIGSNIEEILDIIEENLQDSLCAYFKIILGYLNDDGNFVTLRII